MIILVLGGARSGKSEVAERLAARMPAPVTYVATARIDPGDADMAARIAVHRARRPAAWHTVDAGTDLVDALRRTPGTVLVDSLTTWVAAHDGFAAAPQPLCAALAERPGDTVLVSDEVGMSVHPETSVGLRFRDALGDVNQAVGAVADEVLLVVAGRVLPLERFPGD